MSKDSKGVTFGSLTISLMAMAVILVMALVKVYISNQIYYKSKNVHMLEQEVAILKEENRLLRTKVERLKYKSQILDTMFTMSEEVNDTVRGSEQ